ncbi:MAG: IS4 family transposase [Planctomycetes bacterium]|nr:IS4 family transposase [Planctomycetota bacterium]
MRDCNQGRFQQHFRFLRRQFLQDGDLPFCNILSEQIVSKAVTAIETCWLDRIYPPLITLWVFLGQVLSQDHSCRAAVARLIAHRVSRGQRPCSAETGAYCQARKRLPEEFFSEIARQTGAALEANAQEQWLWNRRRVLAYDGSTVSMPDTPENQQAYPQPPQQKPGVGFPLARIAAFFSLSCGAVIDAAICRYAGKGQSELGMLRALWGVLLPGDVVLADRYMCAWTEMVMLKERGVDMVTRLNINRNADFRRGKRLGKGDHLVQWPKPRKPRSIDQQTYNSLPDFLIVRETRVQVEQPGFRTKAFVIVTTLLDTEEITQDDLAELYRARWNAELDLRSLKETMQMDILRCKTPELVRKEIWTHILAYNLIRTIIAQAAIQHDIEPRSISFKGAIQTLEAFQPLIAIAGEHDSAFRVRLYQQLLDAIATHRVADRPDRFEPRKRKRRQKKYDRMMKPRHEIKRDILNGLSEN